MRSPKSQQFTHKYDDPALDAMGFLLAVLHDPKLPLAVRVDAAAKLLPIFKEPGPEPEVLRIKITGGLPENAPPLTPSDDYFDWTDRAAGPFNKWPN